MKATLIISLQFFFLTSVFSEVKVNYKDNKVEIHWTSSVQSELDHFIIERADKSRKFKPIMKVNVGNIEMEYYEVDYHPPSSIVFYRIKKVAKDGTFKYSKTAVTKNYNKLNYYRSFKKVLNDYKGKNILIVLKNKKGEEFYSKADVTAYKKELIAIPTIKIKEGTYFVIATSDDLLLNKKVKIISREESINSFLILNK
jgi:hypothetical protein